MNGVIDVWLCDFVVENMVDSISIGVIFCCVIVVDVYIMYVMIIDGVVKFFDFVVMGGQVLFFCCLVVGDNVFYFLIGVCVSGLNVLFDCEFIGGGWIQFYVCWVMGLFVDNCCVFGGGIEFINCGEMGFGYGWIVGWVVVWNCKVKLFIIQNLLGVYNWVIGCCGKCIMCGMLFNYKFDLLEGVFDLYNMLVVLVSFYCV